MTKCKIFMGNANAVEKEFNSFFKAGGRKVIQVIPSVDEAGSDSSFREFVLVVIYTQK
jgi:hypothetical protein